ncbi:type I-E CRISPR-associated protein Cas5/CasD [Corynebacterium pseudodiphtheriticum]|uniref:type I-E CRISPR-associated protein Cas5/CasD n=1 Tax=Corynebacterium pseudodiphtheriticum TaxID=37637 RepID=UPI00201C2B76|nr:type I-E CRISPR-associated protein Cas5/CasD [Corynebacterium pseudodiphtheriticum]MDK8613559.1 type I-E CRISPR-associated protein Cas5/CasD [Corynebacterium pseudodiphtheriticum]MDK8737494.1 type I-E CRISPR-associated protein Cas5/CasD [Corynebacterium pseudodiphtheriticum]MDK8744013.1 type I-E CRISPR-associated protein Cas5/CasD [Corynebacterium pseudodiphtheriticum]UQV53504.1 type I-E CRISPR-associated protein Cas5/CasD [Corynebacterium pseudodiphtheriticum]UQV55512.1 type I-E CRISPR-ass
MTSSVYFRLAGPVQSWAKPAVTGNLVRTNPVPTQSALQGLVAAALGAPRGQWPAWLSEIDFRVREDHSPQFLDDYHTIGSREDEWDFRRRLAITQGLRASSAKQLAYKPGVHDTVQSRRTYLADAEFLVQATAPEHTEELDYALAHPEFSIYLGRKAFAASFPFYLGVGDASLLTQLPALVRNEQKITNGKVSVKLYQHALGQAAAPAQTMVPAARSRAEWMDKLRPFELVRRQTQH